MRASLSLGRRESATCQQGPVRAGTTLSQQPFRRLRLVRRRQQLLPHDQMTVTGFWSTQTSQACSITSHSGEQTVFPIALGSLSCFALPRLVATAACLKTLRYPTSVVPAASQPGRSTTVRIRESTKRLFFTWERCSSSGATCPTAGAATPAPTCTESPAVANCSEQRASLFASSTSLAI